MDYRFADRVKQFKTSAISETTEIIRRGKNVISFAGGFPNNQYFPDEALQRAFEQVFASGSGALQYGMIQGYLPLREAIGVKMSKNEIASKPEDILVTTGSQQAIDLVSRIMLSAGDVVLTENPTFLAALQAFSSYEAKVVPVEGDQDGMFPEDLEEKLQRYKPKFIYVVPTFSNPDGKVWSEARRQALLELAYRYDTLILEDDPYGDIQFRPEERYTPLIALDRQRTHVLYTSTFSKSVVPAIRTGWITGPGQIIRLLTQIKEAADLMSSSIDQQALYYLLRDFDLDAHVRMLGTRYREHMQTMQSYLKQLDPATVSWIEPKGGMFLWVKLGEQVDATALLAKAVEQGVAFIPGAPFYVENPQRNTIRMNFTQMSPQEIATGMERLVKVLGQEQRE
ncbi:PLP-dependent aminotransferase family protein [Brevibacillus sp. GCM10020057]|uniref:aminotransferase-like domain-containing protein n=1 Tax=Brevibacillus sp. GCM10020057 TaxID=3317327 RepID=UPI00363DBECC